jgi:hypothetical protein
MSSENEKKAHAAEVVGEHAEASIVDTLFDIGLAWAELGLSQGRKALELSAKTLERAAGSLEDVQRKLRKDAAA